MKVIANKYRMIKMIASGGMGEVYLGEVLGSHGFKRKIAIKLLPHHMRKNRFFREAFINEATTLAKISHPNLVKVFDFGDTGDRLFLCMEYIQGLSLRELMRITTRWGETIPLEIVAKLSAGIAEGLNYIHGNDVIHGDLSPRNIMMGTNGECKILDFGLSRVFTSISSDLPVGGKIGYLAPEVIKEKKVLPPSDIFSFGVILKEMLSDIIVDDTKDTRGNGDAYEKLKVLCDMCLSEDYDKRPETGALLESMKEMKRKIDTGYEINEYLDQVSFEEEYTFTDGKNFEKWGSKKRYLFSAKLIFALLLTSFFLYVFRGGIIQNKNHRVHNDEAQKAGESESQLYSNQRMYSKIDENSGKVRSPQNENASHAVRKIENEGKMIVPNRDGSDGAKMMESPSLKEEVVGNLEIFHVRSYPEDAKAFLNGKIVGETPLSIPLNSFKEQDENLLVLTLDGFKKHTVEISGKGKGDDKEIFVALQRATGFLSVNVNPWAYVYIDGEKIGTTPVIEREIPVGEHTLVLKNDTLDVRVDKKIEIREGKKEILIEDFFK